MAELGADQGSGNPEPAMFGCAVSELKEETEHTCCRLWGQVTAPGPLAAYPCPSSWVPGRVKASMGTVLTCFPVQRIILRGHGVLVLLVDMLLLFLKLWPCP